MVCGNGTVSVASDMVGPAAAAGERVGMGVGLSIDSRGYFRLSVFVFQLWYRWDMPIQPLFRSECSSYLALLNRVTHGTLVSMELVMWPSFESPGPFSIPARGR